ncbi:dockerin type I domain-containing protein [Adhaeretor mobilis]|uniref:Ice-binding protein C-terminal domain-containing protein n=1 Tax=Adhaeretor mobilis TaxID=1930276 RepID=A0A517N148_9BACT|nr:dockerin type I domain-containing protein [Adhaeretor mobilis]QDT00847.1 hypothetical protein HG15A2_41890 [Adhaeretor mobilis]
MPSGQLFLRLLTAIALSTSSLGAQAQLRIVSYNTLNNPQNVTDDSNFSTIFSAIGNTLANGFSKRVDVVTFQEQSRLGTSNTAERMAGLLNSIYGVSTYEPVISSDFADRLGFVYDSASVSFLGQSEISTAGPRPTLRGQFQPIGYTDPSTEFYVYSSHFSSSGGSSIRAAEGQSLSDDALTLGAGANFVFTGDFNFGSHEQGYTNLLVTSNDPLDLPSWPNTASESIHHTQSTRIASQGDSGATGGLDDRFDLQLVSDNLLDGEGLSYIGPTSTGLSGLAHSYAAFGNDGVSYNQAINNTYVGRSQSASVLDALHDFSDHLPVVADYQLPAVLGAQLASMPGNVPQGATINVDVLVQNVANVVAAAGADELDYSISVSGDLFGSASGTGFALAGANSHSIGLDTSMTGTKSGVITVTTSSQGAANALVNIPVSFTVGQVNSVPFLAKDDFDNPMGLISFVQSPLPGAFTSPASGFEEYQVGVSSTIPFQLVDETNAGISNDARGIVDAAIKTDGWFGISDTVNNDNPSGTASATWEFDIAGATGLSVSIDFAAMGDFEESSDFFNFTYSIDGGPEQALFTSSVDEAVDDAVYTLASGAVKMLDDPLSMENNSGDLLQLTNVFQTLTSALGADGDVLTLSLLAGTNGQEEAFAFDNIEVSGITIIVGADDADFNGDNMVDGEDFLIWQQGLEAGATLAQGDANGDGTVDGLDLDIWQLQYGDVQATSVQSVPEPSTLVLFGLTAILASGCSGRRLRSSH